jgi:hypothetical protein
MIMTTTASAFNQCVKRSQRGWMTGDDPGDAGGSACFLAAGAEATAGGAPGGAAAGVTSGVLLGAGRASMAVSGGLSMEAFFLLAHTEVLTQS